jgi:hypothetical protein
MLKTLAYIMEEQKLQTLIKEFGNALKDKNLTKLPRETLFNLISLFEMLNERDVISQINSYLEKINLLTKIEEDILKIRLISILELLKSQKYLSKRETSGFVEYEYIDYIDIFTNNKLTIEEITELLDNIKTKNFRELHITASKTKKKENPRILSNKTLLEKNLVEFIENNNRNISKFKIRLVITQKYQSLPDFTSKQN